MHKLNFSTGLVYYLYEMLKNRKFTITDNNNTSDISFTLHNGLQQGTILAPILFSLYISTLLHSEKLNSIDCQTLAYADDLVIYASHNNLGVIERNLQNSLNFINQYFLKWKIKINVNKCELILFRKPLSNYGNKIRKGWNKISIKIEEKKLEQKIVVKYLGLNIDQYLYFNHHITTQLVRARNAFGALKKLFHSRHIDKTVKLLCYQSLIRPIITYACPIWYNTTPSLMEKVRVFERKCLRACTSKYRKLHNFIHYISNKTLYNSINFDRIDLHIIELIRKHILRSTVMYDKSMLFAPYYTNFEVLKDIMIHNGTPPPEAFIYLDTQNLIISPETEIPLIYHVNRRTNVKYFDIALFQNPTEMRYSISCSDKSIRKFNNMRKKFWWLDPPTAMTIQISTY